MVKQDVLDGLALCCLRCRTPAGFLIDSWLAWLVILDCCLANLGLLKAGPSRCHNRYWAGLHNLLFTDSANTYNIGNKILGNLFDYYGGLILIPLSGSWLVREVSWRARWTGARGVQLPEETVNPCTRKGEGLIFLHSPAVLTTTGQLNPTFTWGPPQSAVFARASRLLAMRVNRTCFNFRKGFSPVDATLPVKYYAG